MGNYQPGQPQRAQLARIFGAMCQERAIAPTDYEPSSAKPMIFVMTPDCAHILAVVSFHSQCMLNVAYRFDEKGSRIASPAQLRAIHRSTLGA